MKTHSKPIIYISRCLGFEPCRYDGTMLESQEVELLKPFIKAKTVCPEVSIGLGVPRPVILIVKNGEQLKLVQPETGRDLTHQMENFVKTFLASVSEVDGWILKSRSPSCGLDDTKIFSSPYEETVIKKGAGFLGKRVLEAFPHQVVDESRLANIRIREHFYTRIFIFAAFRDVKEKKSMKELTRFHSQNKLLLFLYHQKQMRKMGKILANQEKRSINDLLMDYEVSLKKALSRPAKHNSYINMFLHAYGNFSKALSFKEKAFFLDTLEAYRKKQVPASVPLAILKDLTVRFHEPYLKDQTFFEPYPMDLMKN